MKHNLKNRGLLILVLLFCYVGYGDARCEELRGPKTIKKHDLIVVQPNGVTDEEFRMAFRCYVVGELGLTRFDSELFLGRNEKSELSVKLINKSLVDARASVEREMKALRILGSNAKINFFVYRSIIE